jgi:hypothetical protein
VFILDCIDKKATLFEIGAIQVIATDEEDFVARVQEITGAKGARVIFDPLQAKESSCSHRQRLWGGNNLRVWRTCARANTVSLVCRNEQRADRSWIHPP